MVFLFFGLNSNSSFSWRVFISFWVVNPLSLTATLPSPANAGNQPLVKFEQGPGQVEISIGEKPFGTYVLVDPDIPRPYFKNVHAPNGMQVTRNQPPVEGVDRTDHPTFHPGIWLAFGDISGSDYWRLKAKVRHSGFVGEPQDGEGDGSFTVENVYLTEDGKELCREVRKHRIVVIPADELGKDQPYPGYLLFHDSEFYTDKGYFVFGDQEEMGLGVRVVSPLNVKDGGTIINSNGQKNQDEAWGKIADWCDNHGVVEGERIGAMIVPHPENFRKSWFHARDYGLILANPFGRNAYTEGEKSAVRVNQGDRFLLRFGVFIYATEPENDSMPEKGYQQYLQRVR